MNQNSHSGSKRTSVVFWLVLVAIWPLIPWILLKLVGYAVIVLTLGHGYEFVNSTFFRWTIIACPLGFENISPSLMTVEEANDVTKFLICITFTYFLIFF